MYVCTMDDGRWTMYDVRMYVYTMYDGAIRKEMADV